MTQPDWGQRHAVVVGQEIKRLREQQQSPKRSAQWLSDRTSALGYPVTRSTIADLEIGRRKHVLIAELLIIAAALEVPPALLLFPKYPDGDAEALPGTVVTSELAVSWLAGGDALTPPPARDDETAIRVPRRGNSGIRLVAAAKRRREKKTRLGTSRALLFLETKDDPEVLLDTVSKLERDVAELNSEILRLGGTVRDA